MAYVLILDNTLISVLHLKQADIRRVTSINISLHLLLAMFKTAEHETTVWLSTWGTAR